MAHKKITGEIVIQYLDKWTNLPTRTLARKIFAENPKVFTSAEHARSLIRLYRGTTGAQNRVKNPEGRKFYGYSNYNPFKIPDSEAEDDTIFIIPKIYDKIGVLADMHIPYHDVDAMTVALQHCKENKCKAILIDGDAIDFYSLSRFEKDPRNRDVAYELDALAAVIKILNENFGKVFYKIGNHEERYERYLRLKAPELLNVSDFEFENLLASRDAKCEIIRHTKILLGKLPIVHGHEFQSKGGSTVNPARGMFLKAKMHGMVAHSHRTSQHTEVDMMNKLIVVWSLGCLCGLHPDYARINNWNHGGAIVEVDDNGAFDVDNFRIYKNKIRR